MPIFIISLTFGKLFWAMADMTFNCCVRPSRALSHVVENLKVVCWTEGVTRWKQPEMLNHCVEDSLPGELQSLCEREITCWNKILWVSSVTAI